MDLYRRVCMHIYWEADTAILSKYEKKIVTILNSVAMTTMVSSTGTLSQYGKNGNKTSAIQISN